MATATIARSHCATSCGTAHHQWRFIHPSDACPDHLAVVQLLVTQDEDIDKHNTTSTTAAHQNQGIPDRGWLDPTTACLFFTDA